MLFNDFADTKKPCLLSHFQYPFMLLRHAAIGENTFPYVNSPALRLEILNQDQQFDYATPVFLQVSAAWIGHNGIGRVLNITRG